MKKKLGNVFLLLLFVGLLAYLLVSAVLPNVVKLLFQGENEL